MKPIQELSHKDNSEATLRMLKQQYHAMFMDMLAKRMKLTDSEKQQYFAEVIEKLKQDAGLD